MSREAARERLRMLAQSLASLPDTSGDEALLGYPIVMLCHPRQQPIANSGEGTAPTVAARRATPYKE